MTTKPWQKFKFLECKKSFLRRNKKNFLLLLKGLHWTAFLFFFLENESLTLTLFRMGGEGKKAPPTSFSPVTSTNVRFGPQNFLTFSFNPFVTLVQNFKFAPSASPKLLNLNQDHPSKKAIFLVKSL